MTAAAEKVSQYIRDRDFDALAKYVKSGQNLDVLDRDGRTPLMDAILQNAIVPSQDQGSEVVRFLLERGARTDIHDTGQEWTALHFAARDQNLPVAMLLLKHGAEIDAEDSFGNTPLWRCVMAPRSSEKIVELLLEHGADPNRANKSGNSPRDMAIKTGKGNLAKLMNA